MLVEVVDDVDEAVARANSLDFGLTAGILARDSEAGLAIARRLDAGIIHVNDQPVNNEPQMHFGGIKDSGWGRFGVGFAAEEFTELQWVSARTTQRTFPF